MYLRRLLWSFGAWPMSQNALPITADDRRFDNFQPLGGSCLKRKSTRRPTKNCRANIAPLRPNANFRDNDFLLIASRYKLAPICKQVPNSRSAEPNSVGGYLVIFDGTCN
jgi:hypothetical protein